MAVTKEQIAQALQIANSKANDPALTDAERAQHRANATQLSVTYRTISDKGQTTPLTDAVDPERTSYISDRAKVGFTRFLHNVIDNSPLESLAPKLFDYQLTPLGQSDWAADTKIIGDAIDQKAQEWFGADINNVPTTNLQRYAGIAAEAVAGDPIMSVVGARGALGTAFNLATAPIPAVTGAVSYDTGKGLAEVFGASPQVQDIVGRVMGTVGGIAGGVAGGFVTGSFTEALRNRQMLADRKRLEGQIDHASDYLATGSVRTVVDDIVKADPLIGEHVAAIRDISNILPNFEVAPGIALYGNPVIRKNMETLLKESPVFRANVQTNLNDLRTAVDKRREMLFGTTNPDKVQQLVRSNFKGVEAYERGVQHTVNRRIENIDAAMDNVLNNVRTSSDALDVGRATKALIDQKEAAVRKYTSGEYSRILKTYQDQGVEFSPESVANLWNLVSTGIDAKLFTPFPRLVNKVNSLLRPREITPEDVPFSMSGALAGVRPPVTGTTQQFRSLSLEQLDSLKQELNAALRSAYGTNAYPLLRQMKTALNEELDKMPGFGAEYRAVDRSYYERIGLPMDAAGLAQLDSLKFAETVGNYLAKPERAIDFINFVGDAGVPLVKDSILIRLQNKAFSADGSFRPDAYAKFLAENQKLINTVPGLGRELRDIGGTVAQMDALKSRLEIQHSDYAAAQADNFVRATENRGLNSALNQMLTQPATLDRYMRNLKNLDSDSAEVVRRGIRSALLTRAMESSGGARNFIKENSNVFNTVFGETYAKNVEALAQASDILKAVDPAKLSFAFSFKETDPLQRATGTSGPQLGSLLRDRIASLAHRGSILFSRWFTQRTAAKRDDEMMRLLLDTKAMGEIASRVADFNAGKINAAEVAKPLSKYLAAAQIRGVTFAQEGARAAAETPTP